MTDLRERQRDLATKSIIDACAELVTERHHLDFSMKEVAERAGMSLRTVYNHFATREDLLDALGAVMSAQSRELGGPLARDLQSPDDLVHAVRSNLAIFEQLGGISEAVAQMPLADVGRDGDRAARTQQLTDFIAAQMPSAPPDDAHAIAVVLRHLLSHRSWFWLTREYGLSTADVSRVSVWALATLIDTAEAGDLPDTKHLGTKHLDTQHLDTQHLDTQHLDTQEER